MEIRIKTGKDLKCAYTGEDCRTLVKICGEDSGAVAFETHWMGRQALHDALKMIDSIEGVQQVVQMPATFAPPFVVTSETPAQNLHMSPPQQPQQAPQNANTSSQDNHVIRDFASALAELVENPPQSRDNGKDGLAEIHVRDLIGKYRGRLTNPLGLFPVVNKFLGMPRERFDIILSALNN